MKGRERSVFFRRTAGILGVMISRLGGWSQGRRVVYAAGVFSRLARSPGRVRKVMGSALDGLFPVNRPRSLTIEPRLTPFGRRRCYLPDREPLLLAGARRFLMQSAKRKSWGAQAYFFVRRASQDAARQSCARKPPAHPPPLNRAESCRIVHSPSARLAREGDPKGVGETVSEECVHKRVKRGQNAVKNGTKRAFFHLFVHR